MNVYPDVLSVYSRCYYPHQNDKSSRIDPGWSAIRTVLPLGPCHALNPHLTRDPGTLLLQYSASKYSAYGNIRALCGSRYWFVKQKQLLI